jgi:hypothetical protein
MSLSAQPRQLVARRVSYCGQCALGLTFAVEQKVLPTPDSDPKFKITSNHELPQPDSGCSFFLTSNRLFGMLSADTFLAAASGVRNER